MQRKGISFEGQNIYVGLDVHLKTWAVAIMTETGVLEQFAQPCDVGILVSHLRNKYPGGHYYSVYESGFCGFSVHYSLVASGIENRIVNAADVPTTQKEMVNKKDPVDAKKLARSLKNGELRAIHVPGSNTCFIVMEFLYPMPLQQRAVTGADGLSVGWRKKSNYYRTTIRSLCYSRVYVN
jgi:hypothetical protein